MYVPFETLPDRSRLWIYQSAHRFSDHEETIIREEAQTFCAQWAAHGIPLKTSFHIDRGHFLLLAVDEGVNPASGCSIDGSVHMLRSIHDRTGIDFLDRSHTAFWIDNKVALIRVSDLKQAFADGILTPASLTFQVLITSKGNWDRDWVVPAERTWLSRYLPKTAVS